MKFSRDITALFLAAGLLLGGCGSGPKAEKKPAAGNGFSAQVMKIHDGDTVTVTDSQYKNHKLRLYAIDAPELAQEGGQDSMRNLSKMLPKKTQVTVVVENKDRYGREVSTIYKGDVNINREQIRAGQAWHYKHYDKKFYSDYESLEESARRNRIGLWRNSHPQEPWQWRENKRKGEGK